ncbi:MAG: hypothetical protein J5950_09130 [Clostridia bacterium]|nr:hypothetical protein [Clostridia bacterium]
MKRKLLIGILILSVILLGVAMTFMIKNAVSLKNESGSGNGTGNYAGGRYVSSAGGIELDKSDRDYVAASVENFDIYSVVGTDALGRTLQTDGSGGNGRQVALFYTLTHFGTEGTSIFQDALDRDPTGKRLATGKSYWWGKPLFDFYCIDDTWVLRKHIEMFIYAGVDYLVFDTTNGHAYTSTALKLMKLLHEYNEAGWNAPKVVFYFNTDALNTAMSAYSDIYELNKYPDTWYMVDGKPLVITASANGTIYEFFTVRNSQWPNHTGERTPGGYPWIDFDDDAGVYYDTDGKHGVIPVSVAQNCSPNAWFSDNVLYGMTGETGGSRGRSWHDGKDNITEDSYIYGYNFQEEWDNAIRSDAETAMVLQWNEWRAGVWPTGGKLAIFDQMTREYSRDIEPMEGGYFDNYYMQLAENIRKFKNTGSRKTVKKNNTIDVTGAFGQWNSVETVYVDMEYSTERRDSRSHGDYRLTDTTGRNNMVMAKVAKDNANLYFYVQTAADIDAGPEGTWMNLYIDTDGDLTNSWNGYEYRVNGVASDGKLCLEKFDGSGFVKTAEAAYRIYGNQMMLGIFKSDLGIAGNNYSVNFK